MKTNGGRLEVSFPGVKLGVFAGRLEYTVYKGTNLIRQAIVAKTEEPAVAYKYNAGPQGPGHPAEVAGRVAQQHVEPVGGLSVRRREERRRRAVEDGESPRRRRRAGGSIAAFPPPHNFFWARETEFNLGYNWYRKDSDTSFAFGVRQAEGEEDPAWQGHGPEDRRQNFALYSARPGTWQRMAVYFYSSAEPAQAAMQAALAFTRDDHYKPHAGLSGDGDALPHRDGAAADAAWRPRPDAARLRSDEGRRHQHLRAD